MRFSRFGLTFLFALAPAALSAQTPTWLKSNEPVGSAATTRAHEDVHSRLERAHQQWHFAHDRGQRDRTYQREHEQMHQSLAQRHDQWHAQYDARKQIKNNEHEDSGKHKGQDKAHNEDHG